MNLTYGMAFPSIDIFYSYVNKKVIIHIRTFGHSKSRLHRMEIEIFDEGWSYSSAREQW